MRSVEKHTGRDTCAGANAEDSFGAALPNERLPHSAERQENTDDTSERCCLDRSSLSGRQFIASSVEQILKDVLVGRAEAVFTVDNAGGRLTIHAPFAGDSGVYTVLYAQRGRAAV
jgi:hypothetical protein